VRAVLADGYREIPLWQVDAGTPAVDAHPLPATCDVAVVGGGYCGMAAARELADRGRAAVVLEAGDLHTGASTRNGGMVIPELKAGPTKLEQRYGSLGRRMYDAVNEAFDDVEKIVAESPIDCRYQRSGLLLLAHHPRLVGPLRDLAREHASHGEAVHFVERDDLASEIGSDVYFGGMVFERTGGLQPARFHATLVRRALDSGVDVHEHTAALALDRETGGFVVHTSRGPLRARDVFVATNAYADDLLPELRRRVLPFGSYIIATEVLDPGLAREVSPRNRMLVDSKQFLYYWRLSADGRMVFGGRKSAVPTSIAESRDFLYESMIRVHPQLAGVAVEHAWGGFVAMTLDRMPHIGQIRDVWFATGCNGSGVALNTWMGRRVAATICGDVRPPFAELPFRSIPLHRVRNAYLPVVGAFFGARDRFGV
jgi:glycine/D-amino acid oxidase-like deaminating enzyme